jgi:hypothetical protein
MKSENHERGRYLLIGAFLLCAALLGLFSQGLHSSLSSFLAIQVAPARLIQDYSVLGVGGALLNASLVATIGMLLVYFSSITLAGPTIAAIFTMFGFGLFGNSVANITFILVGVFIASKIAGTSFGSYSLIALFGTALGPIVTFVAFDTPLPLLYSLPLAALSGIIVGIILPAVAGAMLSLHQGYNLYNIGFSCGFIGLFAASLLRALNILGPIEVVWNTSESFALTLIIPLFSIMMILFGFIFSQQSVTKSAKEVIAMQGLSGRLPTDFFDAVESQSPWINMGLLGLASFAYVKATGSVINGPLIAGMATVMGFGSFGKSLKNSYPVVLGVIIATLVFGKSLSDPGPLLAALFATTLAPVAGQFGPIIGIIAGIIHLIVVESSGAWHGGLDLYNNGFAGGLSATLIITLIHWYKSNRTKEDFINEA